MDRAGDRDDDFTAFVTARSARLVNFAFLRCGDPALAEDLTSPRRRWSRCTRGGVAASRGWSRPHTSQAGTGLSTLMFLRGDVRRVVYTVRGTNGVFRYDATMRRLSSPGGWVLAHREYPAPRPADSHGLVLDPELTVAAYDAAGNRVLHCGSPSPAHSKAQAATWRACTPG